MTTIAGKKILIIQQRSWAKRIGRTLARNLATEGALLGTITWKRTTHHFITTQKEVAYEFVQSLDDLRENPSKYLQGDHYTLDEICRELGIDSIWPHVNALRNHVRSFGEKHFYSFRQNVSDEDIVLYIQAVYKLIKTIFKDFKPDVIIVPNFVSLPHIMLNLYATRQGVKTIATIDGKVRGVTIFTNSFNADSGSFFERLKGLNSGKVESENRTRAREYIRDFREQFKMPTYFENFVKGKKKIFKERLRFELEPFYLALAWYVKGMIPQMRHRRDIDYVKGLGPTIDWRPPFYILREHFLTKLYRWKNDRFPYYPLRKLKHFVYFPLQYQPESTIDVTAPFFSNQIETARLVAMSLPADYTLAVKEHPAMVGYRTPSYLEKIARTPNVKLIDYRIPTREMVQKASIIVSPNSTTMAEAAFYGKPAIQLGNLGTTLALPNVVKHTDMTTLAPVIKAMLLRDLTTPEYERQLENYVVAMYDTGFLFNYLEVWQQGKKKDLSALWEAYKNEILYTLKK